MTRTQIINFRASKLERQILEKLAQKHNVTTSELLRDLLRNMARQNGLLPDLSQDNQPGHEQPEPCAA